MLQVTGSRAECRARMNLSATYEGSGHSQSATDGKHVLGGACSLVALHGPAGFPSVSRVRPEMARRTAHTHTRTAWTQIHTGMKPGIYQPHCRFSFITWHLDVSLKNRASWNYSEYSSNWIYQVHVQVVAFSNWKVDLAPVSLSLDFRYSWFHCNAT